MWHPSHFCIKIFFVYYSLQKFKELAENGFDQFLKGTLLDFSTLSAYSEDNNKTQNLITKIGENNLLIKESTITSKSDTLGRTLYPAERFEMD